LSDDRIAEILNERASISPTTVAKYRESMMIPVARCGEKFPNHLSFVIQWTMTSFYDDYRPWRDGKLTRSTVK